MKHRSYFAIVTAQKGFTLNGGKPIARSIRFSVHRNAKDWMHAMMAQPFAATGKIYGSKKAPDMLAH